jgi:hypothetical protein
MLPARAASAVLLSAAVLSAAEPDDAALRKRAAEALAKATAYFRTKVAVRGGM